MRSKSLATSAFLTGAILAALVTSWTLLRWHRAQSQLLWTTALQQHLRLAAHVHKGDVQALRANLDQRLPSLVLSVASFGRNEQTLPVLRSTRDQLLDTRREVPTEIQSALQGL